MNTANPFQSHQHTHCINKALQRAETLCKKNNTRLTPVRKRVLELIWGNHQAIGAYAILDQLGLDGVKPAPPTVYRALDFLLDSGLIHRINSLNAYVGCSNPCNTHNTQFFICSHCGNVSEFNSQQINDNIRSLADKEQFSVTLQILEINGICQACRDKNDD